MFALKIYWGTPVLSEYFSFVASWRLLSKAERTLDNLTD